MEAGEDVNTNGGACAACRRQRKRCDDRCPLAPYFPGNKYDDFSNVHRLYGVNNVIRVLNAAPVDLKEKAAETLILEAKMRRDNPVHGSLAVQLQLTEEIDACKAELELVRQQLSFWEETERLIQI